MKLPDTGVIMKREGLPEDHLVYMQQPEQYKKWWWNALHFLNCWLRLRPHMEQWDGDGNSVFRRWWLVRIGPCRPGKWGFALYFHSYGTNAVDFQSHDHPAHVFRLVLKGGYREKIHVGYASIKYEQDVLPFDFRKEVFQMPVFIRHQITSVKPGTWSLFLMAGRYGSWKLS